MTKKLYLEVMGFGIPEKVSVRAKVFNLITEEIVEYFLDYNFSLNYPEGRRAYNTGGFLGYEISYYEVPYTIRRKAYKLARKYMDFELARKHMNLIKNVSG